MVTITAGTREPENQRTRQTRIEARSPKPGARLFDERGSALAVVLVLVVVLTIVGAAMVNNTLTEISIAYNQGDSIAAQYAAEAGLSRAMYELSQNASWAGTTAAIGDGQYVVVAASSGSIRFITSTGTRGGGRRVLKAAVLAVPQSAASTVLANTTATIGTATAGLTVSNTLPSSAASAVQANNRLAAATAMTVNTAGANVIGGLTANGTISGVSCAAWAWTCNAGAAVRAIPGLDIDSAAASSLRNRAKNTIDPIDGRNLYFRGGDATSRCNSGGAWTFSATETQRCWDYYVSQRTGTIGQSISNPVFFVEFNVGEQTRYAIGGSTITFRGASSAAGDRVTSLTITKPAGVVDNDVMIAAIGYDGGSSVTLTPPAGWSLVRRIDNGTAIGLAVYRKVALGEGASYTWTIDLTMDMFGGIQAYAGVDTTAPIDAEAGQPTPISTFHSTPSITTTVANTMLVASFAAKGAGTWTPPAGMTERYDVASNNFAAEGADQVQAAAGATGVKTATSTRNGIGATDLLALKPAVVWVSCTGYAAALETLCIRATPASLYPNSVLTQVTGAIVAFRRGSTTTCGGTTVLGDIAFENIALATGDYTHSSILGDPALVAGGQVMMNSSGLSAGRSSTSVTGIIYTLSGADNPSGGILQGCGNPGISVQHGADLVNVNLNGIAISNGSITLQDTAFNSGGLTIRYDSVVANNLPAAFTAVTTNYILVPISWSSGD